MLKHWFMTVFLGVVLIMPTASAQARSATRYIETLNTWIGEDADALLHQWGQPVKIEPIGEGRFDVTYQAENSYYHAAIAPRAWQDCMFNAQGQVVGCNDRYDPGRPAYYTYTRCYTVFDVEDGTIIKWRWKGDCKK